MRNTDCNTSKPMIPSQYPEFQPAVFGFHDNHGRKMVLSANHRTAERTDRKGWGGEGILLSREPMQVNMLYEVKSLTDADS